jgi:signal peptidase I
VSDDGRVTTDTDPAPITGDRPATPARGMHPRLRSVLGWVVFIIVVVLVSTGARAFAVQTYFVPTPSMTPTLIPGDRIVVDKLASTIHRGDIVVFHDVPADKGGPPVLVKRVIGLPGETISSVGSTVLIDGKPLAEPWLPPLTGICAETSEHIMPTKIAPDHYFMMGDCRGDSGDSRYWGTVPGSYIIGKVDMIIWRNGHPWIHWF